MSSYFNKISDNWFIVQRGMYNKKFSTLLNADKYLFPKAKPELQFKRQYNAYLTSRQKTNKNTSLPIEELEQYCIVANNLKEWKPTKKEQIFLDNLTEKEIKKILK